MKQRVYLAATWLDLARPDGPRVRRGHAPTEALALAMPDADPEEVEYEAFACAAAAALRLLASDRADRADGESVPARRVVVSADVDDARVRPSEEDAAAIELADAVQWSDVVCLHVDDAADEDAVEAALAGDDSMREELAEAALSWYDVTELDELRG